MFPVKILNFYVTIAIAIPFSKVHDISKATIFGLSLVVMSSLIIYLLFLLFSDIEEDVESLKLFSTELIVASVVQCLKVINHEVDLPNSLPGGMSARFRMGTSLANYIQVSI